MRVFCRAWNTTASMLGLPEGRGITRNAREQFLLGFATPEW
jgi:hypothetical protein